MTSRSSASPARPRRGALLSLIIAIPVLLIAGCAALAVFGSAGVFAAAKVNTIGSVSFANALAVPPLAPSRLESDGTRVFELEPQEGSTSFRPGTTTTTRGYNGNHLGPTLVAARGEKVRVDVTNRLDDRTTVHWHGMHLPPAMDGGPHQPIEPDATWSPEWVIDQPAATLWYHPHPHGETDNQVTAGLAGLFYLRDDAEAALALPRTYGVDDVPVIVQDTPIDDDGEIRNEDRGFVGALGRDLIVNGTPGPYLDVETTSVRLRLLNASTARTYNFGFDDRRDFAQIGSDGGLLAEPNRTSAVRLSPGERAEIVVDIVPGERVALRSTEPDLGMLPVLAGQNGGADRFDVLELRAAATLRPSAAVPDALVPVDRIQASDAVTTRTFRLDGFTINGQSMDMDRIDEVVTVGSTEEWVVTNGMTMPHNFHVHDVQFQVASVDGKEPGPELAGWKDTIYLAPQVEYRLLLRFEDYADSDVPYMYHCHLLWHEDNGMMGQFLVVEPGEQRDLPGAPTSPKHDQHPDGYGPRQTEGTGHDH
ncbi:multicopper oxidase family protein [Mycetocola zhujimingii]|uniref:Copper oxidase n=1 Tax=Mycetocola zhujimingii TaxID=2079792 RepID=A0A2U1TH70_9MICO|nr:multicopper oxidase domain-containing protein [Mycetocola zhujimingii]AWB86679.1 copper oxidase [Mycetocola zhujimingii]PWC08216.1 copper oxidase [Mycetocola zhujimingii]